MSEKDYDFPNKSQTKTIQSGKKFPALNDYKKTFKSLVTIGKAAAGVT